MTLQPLIAEYVIKNITNYINPTYDINRNMNHNVHHRVNHQPEKQVPYNENLCITSIETTFMISGYFIWGVAMYEEEGRRYARY